MPPRIARLTGLGALGASAGLVVLYLLFAFATRPGAHAGMDATNRVLTWLSVGGVVLALVLVHVLLGRRLLAIARGDRDVP